MNEEVILDELRDKLNNLIKSKDAVLHKGYILHLSQELDKLIYRSYLH